MNKVWLSLGVVCLAGCLCLGCSKHGPPVLDTDEETEAASATTRPGAEPRGDLGDDRALIAACEARVKAHCGQAGEYRREAVFFAKRTEQLAGYYAGVRAGLEKLAVLAQAGRPLVVGEQTYSPEELKQLWGRCREVVSQSEDLVGVLEAESARLTALAEQAEGRCTQGGELVARARKRINEIESREALLAGIRGAAVADLDHRERAQFEASLTSTLAAARQALGSELADLSGVGEPSPFSSPDRARMDRAVVEAGRLERELEKVLSAAPVDE